jgi:putative ABC transport system permease protein
MNLDFVAKLAWRETKAARRRLALLMGSVAAGVAALVAINGFTENLRTSVGAQAKALLGADLAISSRKPFPDRVTQLVDTLVRADTATVHHPGQAALVTSFSGMAYVTRTAGVRLVQVKAVEPGYPFYGTIVTAPKDRWRTLAEGGRVIVDPTLLPALGARLGDTLALGDARFTIEATAVNVPGDVGVASAFGPRIYIAAVDLPKTHLLQFGSRAEYEYFVKLADSSRAQKIAEARRVGLRNQRVGIRTVEDDRQDLTDTLTRVGNYLGLVALVALLLGGLGVASATHLFIRQKLDTIAVLRCLGATGVQVFLAYLFQSVAMGGLGSLLGAAIGIAVQQALPKLVRDLLPVDVTNAVAPKALLVGIGLGLWVATVFAILPLLGIRRVSPLSTLRRVTEPTPGRRDPLTWAALALLGASVVGLAAVQVADLRDGAIFAAGVGGVVLVLWLASLGLIRAIRRWFPSRLPYLTRQGLANLYRPANQTVVVVLALGFGAFLLSTLFLVQHNLLREFRVGGAASAGRRPNLMFFDIQPDQADGVAALLRDSGTPGSPMVPIVPMRIASIKGMIVAPDTTRRDSTDEEEPNRRNRRNQDRRGGSSAPQSQGGWAVRREYRSTYRDTLTSTEKLTVGAWWTPATHRAGEPARISLDQDIATDLGVKVGDPIGWDVQGVTIETRVANLREIDWGRFQTNFFVVFESGVLERAPQMLVTLVRVDSATARGQIQRRVAERYPNVSAIDLSQVQQAIESVLGRAALAVRFLAFFSLAAGTIVLVGAVTTARLQRLREGVLLKTLGATRRQVLRILVVEYLALGLLSVLVAIVLSSSAGWALAKWVFEASYDLPIIPLAGLTVLVVGLTLTVGLWSSAEVLKRPPLEILRTDL